MNTRMRANRRGVMALVAAVAALTAPKFARAQSEVDLAQRRGLLEGAQRERAEGDHATALQMADAAGRIQMTPSVRLFIAEEQAALGRVLDSIATARQCVQETTAADPGLRNREAILSRCNEMVSAQQARLGRLVLRAPEEIMAGLQVTLNGGPVDLAQLGQTMLVDPGPYEVRATAQGRGPGRWTLTVAPGATVSVELGTQLHCTAVAAGGGCGSPIDRGAAPSGGIPLGGVAVAGAGMLALGASAVLYVLRDHAAGQLEAYCEPPSGGVVHCYDTPDSRARLSEAQTYDAFAEVSLGVGAAAVVWGAAWLIFGRGGDRARERAAVRVLPTRDGAMITVGGTL